MGRLLILSSVRPGQGITEIDTVYSCVIYINKSFQTQAHIHISELTVLLDFPFLEGGRRGGASENENLLHGCMVEFI